MGPGIARFALACLGGVPIVGGVFGAGAGAWSEAEQHRFQKLLAAWLKLQQDEIREIGTTLFEVMARLDTTDDHIRDRIESTEYLSLVKKCFRDWSAAESEEKRRIFRRVWMPTTDELSTLSFETSVPKARPHLTGWLDRSGAQDALHPTAAARIVSGRG